MEISTEEFNYSQQDPFKDVDTTHKNSLATVLKLKIILRSRQEVKQLIK
jgi:hypothetical protein